MRKSVETLNMTSEVCILFQHKMTFSAFCYRCVFSHIESNKRVNFRKMTKQESERVREYEKLFGKIIHQIEFSFFFKNEINLVIFIVYPLTPRLHNHPLTVKLIIIIE